MSISTEPAASHSSGSPYDRKFFTSIEESSRSSAKVIVPLVRALIPFRSVVDIGCGCGAWLKVFQEHGADVTVGYDGDYVETSQLLIPRDSFRAADLARPLELDRSYDLAVCLEVGEHLPKSSAASLVSTLCNAAPFILFSAAIPGQGGTRHINEQWPDYWEQYFRAERFVKLDPFRRLVFHHPGVAFWFKQNVYLYAQEARVAMDATLAEERRYAASNNVQIVSISRLAPLTSVTGAFAELVTAVRRSIRNRLSI